MSKNVTTLDDAPRALSAKPADAAPVAEVAKPAKHAQSGDFCGKRAIVTIANSPGEGGKDAVFVSVAGVAFQLPRNRPWNVPIEIANVLHDANETAYTRNEKTGEIEVSESPRFSFIAIPVEQPAAAEA